MIAVRGNGMATTPDTSFVERLVSFRRDLHQHPELAFHEARTGDRICEQLDRLGISYRRGVARTGIIADIPGGHDDPNLSRVALRADIDALPVHEETGLSFASQNEGIMHACGHDGHTTMILGAAELLSKEKRLPAPVRVLFQPAEERGAGAIAMIQEGALDGVGMIFGGHLDRHYPTGQIVTHAGAVNASTDTFHIEISGKGGHAARPHEGVDAVVVGSLLVMALQTIVSREVNPAHPSVVTVGRFEAGSASNVIAGRAVLEGTVRAQEQFVRDHVLSSLQRVCDSVARLHTAEIAVEVHAGTPPVINSPEMAELARRAATAVVGEENAVPLHTTNMGGEDFAYYMQKIPGCYVRIGALAQGKEGHPAHSSKFDFDEAVLPIGARYFQQVAHVAGEALRNRS
jgi:amidohydrolase